MLSDCVSRSEEGVCSGVNSRTSRSWWAKPRLPCSATFYSLADPSDQLCHLAAAAAAAWAASRQDTQMGT